MLEKGRGEPKNPRQSPPGQGACRTPWLGRGHPRTPREPHTPLGKGCGNTPRPRGSTIRPATVRGPCTTPSARACEYVQAASRSLGQGPGRPGAHCLLTPPLPSFSWSEFLIPTSQPAPAVASGSSLLSVCSTDTQRNVILMITAVMFATLASSARANSPIRTTATS